MSVLNKLTNESRKNLNRCINDKCGYLIDYFQNPNIKEETLALLQYPNLEENRRTKRFKSAVYFLLSKELKSNTKQFYYEIAFLFGRNSNFPGIPFVHTKRKKSNEKLNDIFFEQMTQVSLIDCLNKDGETDILMRYYI